MVAPAMAQGRHGCRQPVRGHPSPRASMADLNHIAVIVEKSPEHQSRNCREKQFHCREDLQFPTEHARTQTYISKKRLTLVGKYSHAASEVALLRTPLKNTRPSSSHMQTSVEQAGGSAAERRVRPGGADEKSKRSPLRTHAPTQPAPGLRGCVRELRSLTRSS